MVTSAFVIIVAAWVTVFYLAKGVNIQPLEDNSVSTIPEQSEVQTIQGVGNNPK